jgi:uncharacterized protein (TIRG00374 family)
MNAVTPGASAGEVMRWSLASRYVPGEEAAASLVVYTFLNWSVTLGFVLVGPSLAWALLDLPDRTLGAVFGVALVVAVAMVGVRFLLHRRLAARVTSLFVRLPFVRVADPEALATRARRIDHHVRAFRGQQPRRFSKAVAFLAVAQVLQVVAMWVLLGRLIPDGAPGLTFLLAFLVRSAAQLVSWGSTFIPGRVGALEGGIAMLFTGLGLDAEVGLSLALLNRARLVCGIVTGLIIGTALEARGIRHDGKVAVPAPDAAED